MSFGSREQSRALRRRRRSVERQSDQSASVCLRSLASLKYKRGLRIGTRKLETAPPASCNTASPSQETIIPESCFRGPVLQRSKDEAIDVPREGLFTLVGLKMGLKSFSAGGHIGSPTGGPKGSHEQVPQDACVKGGGGGFAILFPVHLDFLTFDEGQITHLIYAHLKYDLYDFFRGCFGAFYIRKTTGSSPKKVI